MKYGIPSECVNPIRKERQKGLKRGPYNKQQKDFSSVRRFDERAHLPEIRSNATDAYGGVHNPQLSSSQLWDPVMAARTSPSHPVLIRTSLMESAGLFLPPALDTHSYSAANDCLWTLPSSPSCDYHEGAQLSFNYPNVQNVQQPVNQQASNGNARIL
ncbi:hypothetical protein F5877DRAFT_85766 [Lentinula edodes]|nr:hypothetical protein F5877DRAFT_85766 [Lentinula edodes]